jgi:primosomal protein N' (replication factor Y) (superfamily II helicase)
VSNVPSVARVVLESRLPQLDRLFDYSIPEGMVVLPGVRVKVPLRSSSKNATGFVVEVASHSDHGGALVPLGEVVSDVPVLTPEIWKLARAVADRHAGNAADILRLAIPPRYVRAEKTWMNRDGAASSPEVQVQSLPEYPDEQLGELIVPGAKWALTTPWGVDHSPEGTPRPRGATVVAQLAARALRAGESAVIVVPDWRDLEAHHQALREFISESHIVRWDSDQVGSERYTEFLRCLSGEPVVVVGSRHAVYAPVRNLRLLVVVDDADDAHREPLAPYPHTRSVALVRQQQTGCALVFAGITPSMSVWRLQTMGFLGLLEPRKAKRAQVVPTALSVNAEHDLRPARLPSIAHQGATEALREGPVLVQVFRAGYSSALACAQCGERGMCTRCHGPLRIGSKGAPPSCVWCATLYARWRCEHCEHGAMVPRGQGIGRTVSDFGKAFPKVPVIQSDGQHRVSTVPDAPAIVVATRGSEPLAVGGYRAALLLDGQSMLSRESIGALEDTVSHWEHAISLVHPEGTVFLTEVEGSTALAVASGKYGPLMSAELRERETLRLPPSVRLASVSGPSAAITEIGRQVAAVEESVDVLGPVALGDGVGRIIVRFPYAAGDRVTGELRAVHLGHISRQRRGAPDRVRIVVDDTGHLDEFAGA